MKSRPKKKNAASNAPVMSKDGVPLAHVRRAPNPWAFLLTGAVIGAVVGVVFGSGGADGSYEGSSATAYFLVLFGALGMLLGGMVFAIFDRRS